MGVINLAVFLHKLDLPQHHPIFPNLNVFVCKKLRSYLRRNINYLQLRPVVENLKVSHLKMYDVLNNKLLKRNWVIQDEYLI